MRRFRYSWDKVLGNGHDALKRARSCAPDAILFSLVFLTGVYSVETALTVDMALSAAELNSDVQVGSEVFWPLMSCLVSLTAVMVLQHGRRQNR